MNMISWLGGVPDSVHLKGRRIDLSSHAAAAAAVANDTESISGAIVGMLKFSFHARYDHLLSLNENERDQYNFWRRQCPAEDVERHLLLCKVEHFVSLPQAVPVQQFTDTRPHGLITEMEQGQPDRLLLQNQNMQEICGQHAPAVLLRLPQDVIMSVVSGKCERFFLPDFNTLVNTTKYTWYCNWGRIGLSQASLPMPRIQVAAVQQHVPRDGHQAQPDGEMDLGMLRSIADHLRRFASELLVQPPGPPGAGNAGNDLLASAYHDLCRLQKLIDELDPATVQSSIRNVTTGYVVSGSHKPVARSTPYRAAFVIQVLLQCDLLKSDASLKESVKQALMLILPKSLRSMFLEMVDEHVSPSPGHIRRWRLLLDAAFMKQMRVRRQKDWEEHRASVRWMMVDSSPQGGRDYELVVLCKAYLDDLQHALDLVDVMKNKSRTRHTYEDDEAFILEQEALQRDIRQTLVMERPPPVVLGSGRTSLPDKFAATAHALFLETGSSGNLAALASEVVSCTSDLGTEFNIVRVRGARVRDLLPWLPEESQRHEDDWPEPEQFVHFENALAMPGILHILHNAAKRMLDGLPELNGAVSSLATVADLLRKTHTRERLCQRCFDTSIVGRQLRPMIEAFQGKVHAARWGTIAFATQQMLQIERPLRWGWNLPLFLGASGNDASEQSVKARAVDEAVQSDFWWASLKVLDQLHKAIRHMFAWSEACPCHGCPSRDAGVDNAWERVCAACPMRGRRAPEIACGDFVHELRAQLDTSAAEVLLNMPANLGREKQALLLGEFEKGRASLIFNIALKVSAVSVPPLLLFGVAHLDEQKAREALRSCLASDNVEGLMTELKSQHVIAEAQDFLQGESLSELPSMSKLVAKLRFAFSVERAIEGEHARIHHLIRKAPRHTVAYVSLNRRLPQLRTNLADPSFFEALSRTLETMRNPKLVVQELGLAQHPACADVTHPWDPIFGKIVYRSDPATTQGLSPAVVVRQLPGGGRQARQALPSALSAGDGESESAGTAGSYSAQLLHIAAVEHFKIRLEELCSEKDAVFSVHVSEATLSALLDLPAVPMADATAGPQAPLTDRNTGDGSGGGDGAALIAASDDSGVGVRGVGGFNSGARVLDRLRASGRRLEDVFKDALVQLQRPGSPNLPKVFAFKIVSLNPAQSKLPLTDAFQATDVAISVLRTVRIDVTDRSWVVESSPLRVQASVCSSTSESGDAESVSLPSIPILFSPSSLSFENLMKIHVWEILPETGLELLSTGSRLAGVEIPRQPKDMSELLVKLQGSGAEGFSLEEGASAAQRECFEFLCEVGLATAVQGSHGKYALSEDAKDHLVVTRTLVSPCHLFQVRDIPYADMDLYELVRSLEDKGFKCCVCSSSDRKAIRQQSYTSGVDDKVWWVEAGKPPSKLYLVSLLHAESHMQAVPALADSATAQKILEGHGFVEKKPVPKPSVRKRQAIQCDINEDDWEVPQPPPKKARRKPKAKAKAAAVRAVADADADDHVMPALEDTDAVLASGIGSPVRSPSNEGGVDGDEDGPEGVKHVVGVESGGDKDRGPDEASPAQGSSEPGSSSSNSSSSDSSSSSSSSSSCSSRGSSGGGPTGRPRERSKKPEFIHKKDMSRSVVSKSCRLTPRFDKAKGDSSVGFQMTCLHQNHVNCNKSLAHSVSGSEENTIRMLRAWIAWGQDCSSKEEHKAMWSRVTSAKKKTSFQAWRHCLPCQFSHLCPGQRVQVLQEQRSSLQLSQQVLQMLWSLPPAHQMM